MIKLSKLDDSYSGLARSIGSFQGAVGLKERQCELEWVRRATLELRENLAKGVRRSPRSGDMVEQSEALCGRADELVIDLQQEAARAIRLSVHVETSGASAERRQEVAEGLEYVDRAVAESGITVTKHAADVAPMLGVAVPAGATVYDFSTRRRVD